jgi:murein DD-endopeptidase MepM/ murein hydrolase activator NlpD
MDIQHTMNLYSPSGYAMPFEADENTPIEVVTNYGKHVNEKTGEECFSHGMDFRVRRGTWLKALATGVVSGISSDAQSGLA